MNWGMFCAVIAAFCWFMVLSSVSAINAETRAGKIEEAQSTRRGAAVCLLLAMIFTAIAAGLLS